MKRIYISVMMLLLLSAAACDSFLDVNENPNEPEDVQEKLLLPAIQYNLAHNIVAGVTTIHVNHFMQAIALNQPVPNTGTYLMTPSEQNDTWTTLYTACLKNLALLNEKAKARGNSHYAGIAAVLTAYSLGYATSLWGDVPYSQAFKGSGNFRPAYDAQEQVYTTLQQLLDEGIADLGAGTGLKPGTDDFIYKGEAAKWIKAAYTLKARYYMHLTKAPGYSAAAQADKALAALALGIQANEDDLKFPYPGAAGTENRWYQNFLPISTVIMSSRVVDSLVKRNDPRLAFLVTRSKLNNDYKGRVIGTEGIGLLEAYSLGGAFPANANSYIYMATYTESLYLKAEATLIKSGHAAAEPIYRDAIKYDMAKIGVTNQTDINAYLASRGTLSAANALQRIMEEKNTANLFSIENFVDWRRTGFPELKVVPNALLSSIPRRMVYPDAEKTTNPQAQQSAALGDRMWLDK